jgi:hypothetical protein
METPTIHTTQIGVTSGTVLKESIATLALLIEYQPQVLTASAFGLLESGAHTHCGCSGPASVWVQANGLC